MRNALSFKLREPQIVACCNAGMHGWYRKRGPFDVSPFSDAAWQSPGAPVVFGKDWFIGFLNETGGRFGWDGRTTLTVDMPEGQELFMRTGVDPYSAWDEYNARLAEARGAAAAPTAGFPRITYTTHVEQHWYAGMENRHPQDVMSERFVLDQTERIKKLGLPPGALIIKNGWFSTRRPGTYGDWRFDEDKFPDPKGLAAHLKSLGYLPGIWIAPALVSTHSEYCKSGGATDGRWLFHSEKYPSEECRTAVLDRRLESALAETIRYLADLGFGILYLDLLYLERGRMMELQRRIAEIATRTAPELWVIGHLSDPYRAAPRYAHRVYDVHILPGSDWVEETRMRWLVNRYSSPLAPTLWGSIGGSNPFMLEEEFMDHWRLYQDDRKAPFIGLLPDRFAPRTIARFRRQLDELLS